jgi:putative transposase
MGWKAKYGGMESGDAKKMKQLEDENRKLKHVVAELTCSLTIPSKPILRASSG